MKIHLNLFIYAYFCVLLSISFMSCEDVPNFQPEENSLPVVEAFLYVNEPVDDIRITKIIPFDSDELSEGIDGLEIEIRWNGNTYPLVGSESGQGFYLYPKNDLKIQSGETYELRFEYSGKTITSFTTIPTPPNQISISTKMLSLPQLTSFSDVRELAQNENIRMSMNWNLPEGSGYSFITIENIEPNPSPIDLNDILQFNFEFISSPTQDNFFNILPFIHYSQFGTHQIVVYSVNEEYALLYETIEQDSRDLNEPFTNIENGVGIFSGFASDTIYLEINKN